MDISFSTYSSFITFLLCTILFFPLSSHPLSPLLLGCLVAVTCLAPIFKSRYDCISRYPVAPAYSASPSCLISFYSGVLLGLNYSWIVSASATYQAFTAYLASQPRNTSRSPNSSVTRLSVRPFQFFFIFLFFPLNLPISNAHFPPSIPRSVSCREKSLTLSLSTFATPTVRALFFPPRLSAPCGLILVPSRDTP